MTMSEKEEPKVVYATVRDSGDEVFPTFDIECRFSDGKKFAAIQVDGDFPDLADSIRAFLCKEGKEFFEMKKMKNPNDPITKIFPES
jgi:hypothetical protein